MLVGFLEAHQGVRVDLPALGEEPIMRTRLLMAAAETSIHAAVALMVIDVFICPGGMWSSSVRMWPRCTTGTPTLPTSPQASTWSGS